MPITRSIFIGFSAAIIWCIGTVPAVFSQSEKPQTTYSRILIAVQAGDSGSKSALQDIVSESLAVEFERVGLTPVLKEDAFPAVAASERDKLLESAAKQGIDLAAFCRYSSEETDITIELTCVDTADTAVSASVEKSGDLNLSMDTLFEEAVDEVIAKVKELAPEVTIIPPGPEPPERFYIAAGSAPFIAAGKVNYYFSIGSLTSIYGNYVFTTRAGDIGVGIFTGVQAFRAEGLIAASRNLIIPVGADVHYGTSTARAFSLFLHVTGGAAVFVFRPEGDEALAKMIGYVSGGAGSAFRFKKVFGLSIDVSYFMFFEQLYPIMGFAPSFYGTVRF